MAPRHDVVSNASTETAIKGRRIPRFLCVFGLTYAYIGLHSQKKEVIIENTLEIRVF